MKLSKLTEKDIENVIINNEIEETIKEKSEETKKELYLKHNISDEASFKNSNYLYEKLYSQYDYWSHWKQFLYLSLIPLMGSLYVYHEGKIDSLILLTIAIVIISTGFYGRHIYHKIRENFKEVGILEQLKNNQ